MVQLPVASVMLVPELVESKTPFMSYQLILTLQLRAVTAVRNEAIPLYDWPTVTGIVLPARVRALMVAALEAVICRQPTPDFGVVVDRASVQLVSTSKPTVSYSTVD